MNQDKWRIEEHGDQQYFVFKCPGCTESHQVPITGHNAWGFNGDLEKPTLTPSIKTTWPANPEAEEEFKEWRTERVCHLFMTEGVLHYCGDCTHDLAGKRVEVIIKPNYGRSNT